MVYILARKASHYVIIKAPANYFDTKYSMNWKSLSIKMEKIAFGVSWAVGGCKKNLS